MLSVQQQTNFSYYLQRLGIPFTDPQKKLAEPTDHDVKVVIAGAGSGKTTAMTASVGAVELIAGVPAKQIMAVTFTDRGAREFAHRHQKFMKDLQSDLVSEIKVRTINAMCRHYVRVYYDKLGMPKCEQMSDEDSTKKIWEIASIVMKKRKEELPAKLITGIKGVMSFFNNRMIFDRASAESTHQFISLGLDYNIFNRIRELYKDSQRRTGNLDFDEMMLAFYEILRDNERVRQAVQSSLQVIYIDEFQDTSKLQLFIIFMLKAPHIKLVVIGDPDQSIYRWRGAIDAFGMLFDKYPDAYLSDPIDTNFRCPEKVIRFANNLIRNNTNRIPLVAKGTGKKGKVEIHPVRSNREATKIISEDIIKSYRDSGNDNYVLMDKMVLYRNHSQAMLLVYELAMNSIPVIASEQTLLHKDKMIKDMQQILLMLDNPRNSKLASENLHKLTRYLKAPKQGVECPFASSPPNQHFAEVPVRTKNDVEYVEHLRKIVQASNLVRKKGSASEIFKLIVPMYLDGYYNYVAKLMGKLEEDVQEVANFLMHSIDPTYDVDQFRYLLTQAERYVTASSKDDVGVKVISMHTCKGLQSKEVYLLDMNGQVNPGRKVIDDLVKAKKVEPLEEYINEERSLMYVAITRAMYRLVVTYQVDNPSPFNLESGLNKDYYLAKNVISIEKFFDKPTIDRYRKSNPVREIYKKLTVTDSTPLTEPTKQVAAAVEVVGDRIVQPRLVLGTPANIDTSLKNLLKEVAVNASKTIQENRRRREFENKETVFDRMG